MYADLFAPDGAFGATKGREQLAALARTAQATTNGARVYPLLSDQRDTPPTPRRREQPGSQDHVAIDVGEDGKSSTLVEGGRFDDVVREDRERLAP